MLLDGLDAMPESLTRAWRLDHEPPTTPTGTTGRLNRYGFGQDSSLLLNIVNQLDALTCMVGALGGAKMKPQPIPPPGDTPTPTGTPPTGIGDTHHPTSLTEYGLMVQQMFSHH